MKRILIIDDEKDFCFFVKKNLELTGDFMVETCSDGQEGVAKTKELRPDMVFLDIMMPGTNGADVAEAIKGNEVTRNIPIAFLTALVKEEEAKSNQHWIGGEFFVAKPIKIKELITVINELVK
ncbi:MAG: response regulator [Candidatus Omnitrophota bacterium]|jgi:CheY-like chemotaxis protein